jgi:DNA polymerase (family 10)
MDLDWLHCKTAKDRGVMIEIGPDAHSEEELDNIETGVGMARKAWLTKNDVLNAKPVREVLATARRKRSR